MKHPTGFTLTETVVSIGVVTLLVAVSLPSGIDSLQRTQAQTDRHLVIEALREARTKAITSQCTSPSCTDGSPFGIRITPQNITIFVGSSYGSRNTALDQSLSLIGTKEVSGTTEIVFRSRTGETPGYAPLLLTGLDAQTELVTVQSSGEIAYSRMP